MEDRDHIPVQLMDRLLADAVSGEERERVERHVRTCASCARRLEETRAERLRFLEANPPGLRTAELLAQRPASSSLGWLVPALAAAAALVLLVALWPGDEHVDRRPDILTKGAAGVSFRVHRPSTGRTRPGMPGEALRPGDVIQLGVRPPEGMRHVVVYGLGADGELTRLLDDQGDGARELPASLTVDETHGTQRILVVFCPERPSAGRIRSAVARALGLAGGSVEKMGKVEVEGDPPVVVRSILVRKEKPPTGAPPDVNSEEPGR